VVKNCFCVVGRYWYVRARSILLWGEEFANAVEVRTFTTGPCFSLTEAFLDYGYLRATCVETSSNHVVPIVNHLNFDTAVRQVGTSV
jgi:hypothetical protein